MRGYGRRYLEFVHAAFNVRFKGTKEKPFKIGILTKEEHMKSAEDHRQEMIKFLDKCGLNGLYTVELFIQKNIWDDLQKIKEDIQERKLVELEYEGRFRIGIAYNKWEPSKVLQEELKKRSPEPKKVTWLSTVQNGDDFMKAVRRDCGLYE